MTYCVGLTGNLASGKSTVANMFFDLGVDVLNADTIAKELTLKDTYAYREIIDHFGVDVLNEDTELNRRKLREIIFANKNERLWLEQLLHPLIREQLVTLISQCTSPYCLIEIPLLLDRTLYPYLNKVLLVTASQETQISRVMKRDHCSKEHALAILAAQPTKEQQKLIADDVLFNDSNLDDLKQAVIHIHHKYLVAAKE